jgi:hypothetical protein
MPDQLDVRSSAQGADSRAPSTQIWPNSCLDHRRSYARAERRFVITIWVTVGYGAGACRHDDLGAFGAVSAYWGTGDVGGGDGGGVPAGTVAGTVLARHRARAGMSGS